MIHTIFSVHDVKAGAYLPPFILPKAQMAIRVFSDCINSPDHQFGAHPADYTLFALGTFDDETGTITKFLASESLGNGVEFIEPPKVTEDLFAKEGDPNGKTTLSDAAPVLSGSESGDSEK